MGAPPLPQPGKSGGRARGRSSGLGLRSLKGRSTQDPSQEEDRDGVG